MSADQRPTELDEHARELFEDYRRAVEILAEYEAFKIKARDQLIAWFQVREANTGTEHGKPIVSYVDSEALMMDTRRFREDEPATWAAYAKPVRRQYLRIIP
jgi:hypothetical protein